MKHTNHFYSLIACIVTLWCNASEELNIIQNISASLAQHNITSQAIMQELLSTINRLHKRTSILSEQEQQLILQKEQDLIFHYANTYKTIINTSIKNAWQIHGKTIITIATNASLAAMSSATLGLLIQEIKMGLGNLETLDTNTLMLQALSATMASIITELNTQRTGEYVASLIGEEGANTIINYLQPLVFLQEKLVATISLFSPQSSLQRILKKEMQESIQNLIQENGGILQIIRTAPIKKMFARQSTELVTNELTTYITPYLQSLINNPKIAHVITQVGWIAFESALIGGLLYSAGLGYSGETSTIQSMQNSALRGIIQGSLAYLATATTHYVGGVITLPIAPITSIAYDFAQGAEIVINPQHAASSFIHATAQTITDFVIDESGGLMNVIRQSGQSLIQSTASRWLFWWQNDFSLEW